MKVRANAIYRYNPVLLDQIDGRTSLKTGDLVRVVNLPGCPRANTMGHCHVADPNTGHFIGLVCCNSLEPVKDKTYRVHLGGKRYRKFTTLEDARTFCDTVARETGEILSVVQS